MYFFGRARSRKNGKKRQHRCGARRKAIIFRLVLHGYFLRCMTREVSAADISLATPCGNRPIAMCSTLNIVFRSASSDTIRADQRPTSILSPIDQQILTATPSSRPSSARKHLNDSLLRPPQRPNPSASSLLLLPIMSTQNPLLLSTTLQQDLHPLPSSQSSLNPA
jgi:hypothetical protein